MADDTARTSRGEGVVLTPDPSALTTLAIDRAMHQVRELLEARLDGEVAALIARADASDQAVRVLSESQTRFPTDLDRATGALREHILRIFDTQDEKFRTVSERFHTVQVQFEGVSTQFEERDTRGRESTLANTTAINAALAAQSLASGEQAKSFKESIEKSEKSTQEQITQQRVLAETNTRALEGTINDLKNRIVVMESTGVGRAGATTDQRANIATIVAVAGLVLLILGYFATH